MSKAKAAFLPDSSQDSRIETLPPISQVRVVPHEETEAYEGKPASRRVKSPAEGVRCTTKVTTTVVIIVGLMIHFYDTITDILYIANAEFINQTFYICALVFMLLTPALQLLLTVSGLWRVYRIQKRSEEHSEEYTIGVRAYLAKAAVAGLLIALGLFDFIFLYVVMTQKSSEVFEMFDMLSKSFAFLSAVFKSIPQIIVTMLNNYYTNSWDTFGIISISAGGLASLYDAFSCLQSFSSIPQERHDEEEEGHFSLPTLSNTLSRKEIEKTTET
jgi:hypothetical protein